MSHTYIDTPYSDTNPAPPIHDEQGCIEWCSHCALCGVGILYGARCRDHYGVYPVSKPTDPCTCTDRIADGCPVHDPTGL